MAKRPFFPFLVALFSALTASTLAVASIGDRIPQPKPSYYGTRILKFLEHWPPPIASRQDARPVFVRAIRTPGHPEIIGLVKHFTLDFPIEKVSALTDSFENYPKIWDDLDSVKVEARDGDHVVTDWVRKAPAFFLSKIRYRLLYTIDRSVPGRVVYRQQLIDGNSVLSTDEVEVLEKRGDTRTRITVLDFFSPDVGALGSLIRGKIWSKSLENTFKDDIAFRSKLEHPDWDPGKLGDAADHELDRHPFHDIQYVQLPELGGN